MKVMLKKTISTGDQRQFPTFGQLRLVQHGELRRLFLERVKFDVTTILITPSIDTLYLPCGALSHLLQTYLAMLHTEDTALATDGCQLVFAVAHLEVPEVGELLFWPCSKTDTC